MWARATIRSQRRSLIATALLLGLVGAIVLGAAAGARRTSGASGRYQAETLMPEGFVNVESLLAREDMDADEIFASVESIAELPGVTALAPFAFMAIAPLGEDGEPIGFGAFVPTDGRMGTTVARPLVHEGRSPEPTAVDEVGINRALADALGVGPGDRITIGSIADFATEAPGPEVEVTVTGVETGTFDLLNEGPAVHPTAAFYEAMGDDIAHGEGYSVVNLERGADDAAFLAAARAIFDDREDAVIQAFGAETPGVQPTIDAQALALGIGAGVFALAAVVIIGQAVARHVSRIRRDETVLAAVGMTRFERAGAAAASIAPAAIGGALLALVAAWSASPFMPIGVARTIEPKRGFDFDTTVLVGGAIALALLTIVATAVIWYLDIRRDESQRSTWAATVARPLSPPAGYGVRRALRPTHAVLSRVGTVAGLTGVIAALVFGAALSRLLDRPDRYGIAWDGEIVANSNDFGQPPPSRTELAAGTETLRSDGDVLDTTVAAYTDGIVLNDLAVAAYGIEGGGFEPTIVRGRAAAGTDELTLGPGVLDDLGLSMGDTVTAVGADGEPIELTIVGEALFPVAADNAFDLTAGLSLEGFERLSSEDAEYRYLLDLRDGADPEAVVERHRDLGIDGTTTRPTEVGSLSSIDGYPLAFAIVFGVMAAGAAVYGLTSGLRSSRRDIAVLRAVGFTGRDVRTTVRSWLMADLGAAFVLAVVAGVVIGRRGWAVVADGLHVANDGLVPILGVGVVVAGVLLVGALLSPVFGRTAETIPPTTALRIE